MGEFDKGSAWLISHYGETLLALAGISVSGGVTVLANTVVLPSRVPDGLLEANEARPGETPDLFLLEVATRGETRLVTQMTTGLGLAELALGRLPDGSPSSYTPMPPPGWPPSRQPPVVTAGPRGGPRGR